MITIPYGQAVLPGDWEKYKDLVTDHCPSAREQVILVSLLARQGTGLSYLEVGCHRGQTMLGISRALGPDVLNVLVGIDPGDQVPAEQRLPVQSAEYLPQDKIGAMVHGVPRCQVYKTTHFDYYRGVVTMGRGGYPNLVFIDADHRSQAVYLDTHLALRECRKGGHVVWHDVHNPLVPGVDDALLVIGNEDWNIDIYHVEGTMIAFAEVP